MHFSIPETENLQDKDGSYYQGYHVHINGNHHCTLRYKQLRHLHDQLKKLFSHDTIPEFPSKKLLPLTTLQLEERRLYLEKYLQSIALDHRISSSTFFHAFLRMAQNETHLSSDDQKIIHIRITLPGEEVISIPVTPIQETSSVIKKVAQHVGLPEELADYFALFIQDANEFNQYCLVRRLLNYESPFLAVKLSGESASLVMRKSYWDSIYDDELLKFPIGTKLVYNQFRDDHKRYWIQPNEQQLISLKRLIDQDKQHEVMKLARQIRFYGGVNFLPCLTDFPTAGTPVSIHALNKELVFCYPDLTERSFRVTRMRSWRITTIVQEHNVDHPKLELSFEYLLSKDRLQWITVDSTQVIFLSLCLQSMVEELMRKQQDGGGGSSFPQLADEVIQKLTFLGKHGNLLCISESTGKTRISKDPVKKSLGLKESIRVRFRNGRNHSFEEARIENHAFEDIRDEDL
ncbi:sorting nexin-17-like [Daphnia pulicaria]|uniref:sorting nexin-17-like n=1 Tax=Daphnia pulicaria TaxID=35523 RepID=UPI001EECDBE1|nr:sorting nexin-17-like [Daphnia pulicaria]